MAEEQTFFWYDLETTGINPREGRIMQFAGQRTDMDLQPIGEPVNVFIKLTEDVLPDPEAVLITGITPQQTIRDGITEAEFLRLFYEEVAKTGTIFVGYNTVRFDDEFMRYLHYRNFYDAYEWQYKENRSRWDLLDMVRMTRALRPEGIEWPFTSEGLPTNRLELITKLNGLDHEHAHDALNDVLASIAVARLVREKQPKLFDWLLNLRNKDAVKKFLQAHTTFIYSSGKYAAEVEKTAVVTRLWQNDQGVLVYDLRHDPSQFIRLTPEQIIERWGWNKDPDAPARLPIKTLKYNRCPALSPTGLLQDKAIQDRLQVTPELITNHLKALQAAPDFVGNVLKARAMMDEARSQQERPTEKHCDERLYDDFFDDHDRRLMPVIRATQPNDLHSHLAELHDQRLKQMLPLYKARNFLHLLDSEERAEWEKYCYLRLMDGGTDSRMAKYMHHLGELVNIDQTAERRYLLEELQLYAESIMPLSENY
jgi:exodeoxyribonuclease-1